MHLVGDAVMQATLVIHNMAYHPRGCRATHYQGKVVLQRCPAVPEVTQCPNEPRALSVHRCGSSSRNMIQRFSVAILFFKNAFKMRNASIQDFGLSINSPLHSCIASRKASICSFWVPCKTPVIEKASLPLNNWFTRNVLPTRRLPYMATNSGHPDDAHSSNSLISCSLPAN